MRLKELRESKNLSQLELAEMCGLTQAYISFIESGDRGRKLPVQTAKKIAEAIGVHWTVMYEDITFKEADDGFIDSNC